MLVTDLVLNNVPLGLTVKKFQKMFKNIAERLLLKLAQERIFMYFLIENPTHKKLFGVTRR